MLNLIINALKKEKKIEEKKIEGSFFKKKNKIKENFQLIKKMHNTWFGKI